MRRGHEDDSDYALLDLLLPVSYLQVPCVRLVSLHFNSTSVGFLFRSNFYGPDAATRLVLNDWTETVSLLGFYGTLSLHRWETPVGDAVYLQ